MSDYRIGHVVAVSADRIFVELGTHETDDGPESGVPETMVANVSGPSGPVPILVGQPGTFVTVQIQTGRLLCIVVDIDMRETKLSQTEVREAKREESFLLERPTRLMSVIPVGTLDSMGAFLRGTDVLPTVASNVYAVLPDEIDRIYAAYAEGDFSLGTLSLLPGQAAKINLDAYLARHSAMLGQTGSGKSWAVASILQKIAQFPQATTILLDLHGEYVSAFGDYADTIDASEIELPYWLMNSEELLGLMVDRSEMAAPNQVAKFKELLQAAKENDPKNKQLGIPKITIDTPVYFDFQWILDQFAQLDTEMVRGAAKEKQGPLFGQFTRLLMRIGSRLNDKRYDLIFHPKTYNTSASMEDLFRRFLGRVRGGEKKVVVIDISPIPFDVRTSVIALIMRCLFDFAYWHKRVKSVAFPIALFCDEAHLYLNENDSGSLPARLAAERIAKEGRKYGISLNVISQRPREVSATILSQCNSFVCLRITNPDDQAYVKNLLPDSIRGIVSMFAILRRGECVVLGDSVIMPTRIHIDKPNPTPQSGDVSFVKEWSSDIQELECNAVLQAWRNQEAKASPTSGSS